MNKLTADTITDDQIEALRTEAGAARDDLQVRLCDTALGHETHLLADPDGRRSTVSPGEAREICADAINEALAADTAQAVRS